MCREAGALVQCNAFLRDMNVGVNSSDERRVEVLASGLPCYNGAQLAVDITVRHFLTATGGAQALACERDGRLLAEARTDKERQYRELLRDRRCRLVVVAISTGGRWSSESLKFIRALAFARARSVPSYMRMSAVCTWQKRWQRMLSVAAATAFAHGLLAPAGVRASALDGHDLELCDLFACRDNVGEILDCLPEGGTASGEGGFSGAELAKVEACCAGRPLEGGHAGDGGPAAVEAPIALGNGALAAA